MSLQTARDTYALNLGAGEDTKADAWNVDIERLEGVDEVVDLNEFPWPWADNSMDTVYAYHILEHLEDPIQAVQECERILMEGGRLEVKYPIGHTRFEDPQHQHYWNYHTAAAIVGERKHAHEHVDGLALVSREVDYTINSPAWRAYTRLRMHLSGPGAWLSQIPTLSGHVHATYKA